MNIKKILNECEYECEYIFANSEYEYEYLITITDLWKNEQRLRPISKMMID